VEDPNPTCCAMLSMLDTSGDGEPTELPEDVSGGDD